MYSISQYFAFHLRNIFSNQPNKINVYLERCEYNQILNFIDSKIPKFFEKYPGYKIFLLKLQYFSLILKEEPKEKIMHFFNKDLFPLLNKYTIKGLDQDFFDFKSPHFMTFFLLIIAPIYAINPILCIFLQ